MPDKSKSFNISYNRGYNILFDFHIYTRKDHRNLELDLIKEAVKTGKIIWKKKNKFRIERYFGKINLTYTAIVFQKQNYTLVKTAWKRKGR